MCIIITMPVFSFLYSVQSYYVIITWLYNIAMIYQITARILLMICNIVSCFFNMLWLYDRTQRQNNLNWLVMHCISIFEIKVNQNCLGNDLTCSVLSSYLNQCWVIAIGTSSSEIEIEIIFCLWENVVEHVNVGHFVNASMYICCVVRNYWIKRYIHSMLYQALLDIR